MPAGYTHMTLSRKALDSIPESHRDAKLTLLMELGAYINGTVGPDIPYMTLFDDHNLFDDLDHVADRIHTHHTMDIPWAGLRHAKELLVLGEIDKARATYAFFLGYLSHVVLDGFTHPFIRDRVGDYSEATKVDHRDLEMQIDVLVLDHYVDLEANGVAPQKDLTLFQDSPFQRDIYDQYSVFLKKYHNKDVSGEKLFKLSNGMIRALDIAEGQFPSWYSMALSGKGLSYLDLDKVKKNEKRVRTLKKAIDADQKGIIYNSLGLDDIDIFDHVFPKYLNYFPKIIASTYDFVFNGATSLEELVPPINLDTGQLLSSTTLKDKPALWELA